MDSFQLLKAVIIGDSRVEGYCKTLNCVLNVVEKCQFSEQSHEEISLLAENYLNLQKPNVIVLITLLNDLISNKNKMKFYCQMDSFNPKLALENIKYYSERWSSLFPGLVVIWTIPDVPNMIEYNINYGRVSMNSSEKRTLLRNEKDIYKHLNYLRENWENELKLFPNIFILSLRGLAVNEIQEKATSALHAKYDDIRVFHSSKFYKDGVNPVILPQPLLAELFASEIKTIITTKFIPTLTCSGDETYREPHVPSPVKENGETYSEPRSPSPVEENLNELTKNILRRLKDRHEMEWFSYISNPQSHPDYESEKSTFMEDKAKEMAFKGVYPSAEEISTEWSLLWKNRLQVLYDEVWKKKKQDCLELLPSRSSYSRESIEFLPTAPNKVESGRRIEFLPTHMAESGRRIEFLPTHMAESSRRIEFLPTHMAESSRRRHNSYSYDSNSHHRNYNIQDYENNHRMYYYGSRGRSRNRPNKHYYSESRQFH